MNGLVFRKSAIIQPGDTRRIRVLRVREIIQRDSWILEQLDRARGAHEGHYGARVLARRTGCIRYIHSHNVVSSVRHRCRRGVLRWRPVGSKCYEVDQHLAVLLRHSHAERRGGIAGRECSVAAVVGNYIVGGRRRRQKRRRDREGARSREGDTGDGNAGSLILQ